MFITFIHADFFFIFQEAHYPTSLNGRSRNFPTRHGISPDKKLLFVFPKSARKIDEWQITQISPIFSPNCNALSLTAVISYREVIEKL